VGPLCGGPRLSLLALLSTKVHILTAGALRARRWCGAPLRRTALEFTCFTQYKSTHTDSWGAACQALVWGPFAEDRLLAQVEV
jgi:hypothetical protein